MKIYPPLEEFSRLAATHNLIPIYTEISGDLETPVSLYLKLVGGQTGFMLESAESGRNFGRYSFIGYRPLAELAARAEQTELTGEQGEKTIIPGKPLDVLRRFLNAFKTPAFPAHAPFWGGGVGYFAYDLIAASERVRGYRLPPDHELMRLLFCRLVVIFDHLKHTLQFVYLISVPEPGRAQAAYEQGADELKVAVATVAAKRPSETENGGQTVGGKFSPLGQDPATARRY
ncbi:MAG: hypothetical protein N2491_08810, partial [Negativicutes bacterium]|nr:hypothetical protein [Negativicutes bacterium]